MKTHTFGSRILVSLLAMIAWSAPTFGMDDFLEIYCPSDKTITHDQALAKLGSNNFEKPVIHGYGYHLYGPWVEKYIHCEEGYIKVKWQIKDHYGKIHHCQQYLTVVKGYHHNYGNHLSIECPEDASVSCSEFHYYQYPKPKVHGYGYQIYGPWVDSYLDKCGRGKVKVTWKIVDDCGHEEYCTQWVWVTDDHHSYNYSPQIWWPKDFETQECYDDLDPHGLSWPYGLPKVGDGGHCSKLAVSYKDEVFYTYHETICQKIYRKWTVIDWCQYDPYSYNYTHHGKWTHTQIIKVISGKKPDLTCPEM